MGLSGSFQERGTMSNRMCSNEQQDRSAFGESGTKSGINIFRAKGPVYS